MTAKEVRELRRTHRYVSEHKLIKVINDIDSLINQLTKFKNDIPADAIKIDYTCEAQNNSWDDIGHLECCRSFWLPLTEEDRKAQAEEAARLKQQEKEQKEKARLHRLQLYKNLKKEFGE